MAILFSYGTLQQENVQLSTFGRRLRGRQDQLVGFEEQMVKIDDPKVVATSGRTHHPIVTFNGRDESRVSGTAFEVTDEELARADRYEVAAYRRVSTTLASGDRAWVYVDARFVPETPGSGPAATEITARVLAGPDWQVYRDLRLRALKDSPDAFGTTYEESCQRPDEYWMSRLKDLSADADLPLVAEGSGRQVGLAWGRIEPADPGTAQVFQMWVVPAWRGRGVGRLLLRRIVDWARGRQVDAVVLSVACGNEPARLLYETAGFRPFGAPERIRRDRELLVQNMRLTVGHDAG